MVEPIAFRIGSLSVAWYGIVITCGMLVALAISIHRLKRINVASDDVLTLFLICIPLAVIFARIGHVVSNISYYEAHPEKVIAIWEGGLTIMWGVPGGVLGGVIWAKIWKKDFFRCADLILPSVLIAQAIGRWGNFFNQELYGMEITNVAHQWFPLGVYIAREGAWFQATFFYEMVLNTIGFFVLGYLIRHIDVKGFGTLSYPAWYCLVRGSLEFIRAGDPENVVDKAFGFNSVILFCYLAAAICIVLMVVLCVCAKKKGRKVFFKNGIPPLPKEKEKEQIVLGK